MQRVRAYRSSRNQYLPAQRPDAGGERDYRRRADMRREHGLKHAGPPRKRTHNTFAQARTPSQDEHEIGHEGGPARQGAMPSGVSGEVARDESAGQRGGMPER